ncbi:MAG: hypothetical protein ACR2GP_14325 [Burkholderiaceae bacterium]
MLSPRFVKAVALFSWLAIAPCLAHAVETQRFTTAAHDLKTGRVLYTENYEVQVENGRWTSGTTRYFLPGGVAIGVRKFDFSTDRYMPIYTLDQSNVEYHEAITRIDAQHVDVSMLRDGQRHAASLTRVQNMVADCGSQPYVVDHLEQLEAGTTLHFTLAVAGKTDSFRLRARKLANVEVDGRRAMRVRIELDSLLRLLLPPLELTIDMDNKQILEYSGITNLKDPATRKAYSAKITFNYK